MPYFWMSLAIELAFVLEIIIYCASKLLRMKSKSFKILDAKVVNPF